MRALAVALAGLALAGEAGAAPPVVAAASTPARGVAPLRVVLTATGDAATYRWDFGDGTVGEGPQVTHVYAAGRFVATVTGTGSTGETAQAQAEVVARRQSVSLRALGSRSTRPGSRCAACCDRRGARRCASTGPATT